MISEGLEKLEQMVKAGVGLEQFLQTPRIIAFDKQGEIVVYNKPKPTLAARVDTVASFVEAVTGFGINDPSIWVSFDKTVCVVSETEYRDDRIALPLDCSPFFKVLDSQWRDHKSFVDMLRHALAGAEIGPDNLLQLVRNLRFFTSSETNSNLLAASAAVGKQALAEVTGESALPEQVTIEFQAYPSLVEELTSTVVVTCSLFVDAENRRLKIEPLPGELDRCKSYAKTQVAAKLKSLVGETPVYVGTP